MSRNGRHLFTSESVTEGHPDKIADQISDAHSRRHPRAGSGRPRRVRDAGHDRPGRRRRRDHDERLRRLPEVVRAGDHRRRLHARASTASTPRPARCSRRFTSSRPTSPGRRHRRRRRPGPDVRLRLHRDRRADAAADHAGAQARARAVASCAATGALDYLRPGRQVAGHGRVRRRPAGARRRDRRLHPAQPGRHATRRCARTSSSTIINRVIPGEHDGQEHEDLRQPDRTLRRRRSARRRRRHRPQDHRRHLRRRRAARRRRVLGQGSDEGRPLGLLHGALHREERRRGRPRRPRARAARLRHRRGRPGVGAGRHRQAPARSPTRRSPSSCARTSS